MVEDVVSRWSLAGEAPFAPGGPQVVGERVVLWPPVQTLSPASDQVGYRPTWRILMSSGSHSYCGQMCVCNFSTKLPWISKLIRRSRSGWSAPQSRLTIAACALRRWLSSPRKASVIRRPACGRRMGELDRRRVSASSQADARTLVGYRTPINRDGFDSRHPLGWDVG